MRRPPRRGLVEPAPPARPAAVRAGALGPPAPPPTGPRGAIPAAGGRAPPFPPLPRPAPAGPPGRQACPERGAALTGGCMLRRLTDPRPCPRLQAATCPAPS